MQAGKLRQRLDIQTNTPTLSTIGQPVASWATGSTVWGWVRPLRGEELIVARHVSSQVTHEITLRHTTLTAGQRLLMNGTSRAFNVEFVGNVDERNRMLRVLAVEVTT